MRTVLRTLAGAAAVATLSWPLVAPVAAAEPGVEQSMVATIGNGQSWEFERSCDSSTPGPCALRSVARVSFPLSVSNFSGDPIIFDFEAEGITATPGADFEASGQVYYSGANPTTWGWVRTKVDDLAEPDETFRIRLTGASRPVDISDTAIGTITDGDQFPDGCTASRIDSDSAALACTNIPAGQQWRFNAMCGGSPFMDTYGNIVTGNGTSTATCPGSRWLLGWNLFFREVT